MDGILVVDKPAGMTSHDVVAFARRVLRQPRIGHTGTLDPFATGVLPLACGRATRLARFMSASSKTYDATVLFGIVTDTYDITGTEVARTLDRPDEASVLAALERAREATIQTPPAYSAKKIAGKRAYDLARQNSPVVLAPASVRILDLDVKQVTPDRLVVELTCSAGFYVRSFAHDLGAVLGVGACLETLRRTASGRFTLAQATTVADLEAGHGMAALVGMDHLLPEFDTAVVGPTGRDRLAHGQMVRPEDIVRRIEGLEAATPDATEWVRVADESGRLLGICVRGLPDGTLRPNIVLT